MTLPSNLQVQYTSFHFSVVLHLQLIWVLPKDNNYIQKSHTLHNRSFQIRYALLPNLDGCFSGGISSIHLLRIRSISNNRVSI